MKEINERQYLMNLGDEAMIVLNRYPSGSDLTYVSPNNERTTLKVVHHDYIIGGRRGMLIGMSSRHCLMKSMKNALMVF
jgi:hypothetical protein